MSYWVQKGIQELENWEQKALSFLSERLSPDDISYYLDECQRDILGLYERVKKKECLLTPSFLDAIQCIFQIRSLLEEAKQPLDEFVSIETAAHLALQTFRVGLVTGRITPARGMEVFEPLAKTRYAQKKNQPKTRSRINIEKDDIMYRLEEYHEKKGNPPTRLDNFLLFISNAGYEIRYSDKTVMSPTGADHTWIKPRAFGTIENDIREYKQISTTS